MHVLILMTTKLTNKVSCNLCYLMFLTYQKERKMKKLPNAFTMNWKNWKVKSEKHTTILLLLGLWGFSIFKLHTKKEAWLSKMLNKQVDFLLRTGLQQGAYEGVRKNNGGVKQLFIKYVGQINSHKSFLFSCSNLIQINCTTHSSPPLSPLITLFLEHCSL